MSDLEVSSMTSNQVSQKASQPSIPPRPLEQQLKPFLLLNLEKGNVMSFLNNYFTEFSAELP